MPTWYSIRNRLEAGEVKARNTLERFFTGFITSYGCIDVWYRSVGSDSTQIECRIYYIQKDPSYTATESWERDNERPEYWLQIKGSEAEIRASIISLLPHIAKLHDSKRHGEWTYGATQPFAGQGSIITTVPGTGYVLVTGRFGDIVAYNDGTELNWEDITWEFDGCSPTATIPPADTLCFQFGNSLRECAPVNYPIGTCLIGDCGAWVGTYPQTEADCTAAGGVEWYEDFDYSGLTSDQWDDLRSCPDPTGTCVTGTCGGGWTVTYPVTEAACSGNWYKGVDLTGETNPDYWDDLYCPDPLGCCVVGSTCDWDSISVTTQSQCTALGGTWTEGIKGKECTIAQYEEDNGCNPSAPQSIVITATLYYTLGYISFIPWPGFEPYLYTRSFNSILRPAITPGTKLAISPTIPSAGAGLCDAFRYSNFDPTRCQAYGTQTMIYNFTYLHGDENDATYGIDSTVGHPGLSVSKNLVTYNTAWWDGTCGGDSTTVDGIHAYQYEGQAKKVNGTVNGLLRRVHDSQSGTTVYTGSALFTPQTNPNNTRTITFGGSSYMTVPPVFVGPSKFVTQGLPSDIYSTQISLGDLTLNTEISDTSWGYPDAEFFNTPDVIPFEAYRITTAVLETS